ncbi:MAG: type 3-dehydroquinate dehydratase [Actinomycetota bacterium]|jgi:3-dehydroquinate dehydratase-2
MTAVTRVLVLNGPNLNRLGTREPTIYGTATLDELRAELSAATAGVEVDLRQSNDEAELIGWLHDAVDARTPVILNPAAFTHYSYALRDAVALVTEAGIPVIEVHLSNPHAREEFRHTSVISGVATGVIAGFGFGSYRLALDHLLRSS